MTDIDVIATDRLLTTTRSVRRRLDLSRPVPLELVEDCLTVALQAPTGGNLQLWRWLVVTDQDQRARIAEYYRRAWAAYKPSAVGQHFDDDDPRSRQLQSSVESAQYLADHLHQVPLFVVPCVPGLPADGLFMATTLLASVLPAVWSFMLAARARGLGSTLTTLTVMHERDVAAILGLPDGVSHCALVPVAYYRGDTFHAVTRLPVRDVSRPLEAGPAWMTYCLAMRLNEGRFFLADTPTTRRLFPRRPQRVHGNGWHALPTERWRRPTTVASPHGFRPAARASPVLMSAGQVSMSGSTSESRISLRYRPRS